jgi:hypothetical protein
MNGIPISIFRAYLLISKHCYDFHVFFKFSLHVSFDDIGSRYAIHSSLILENNRNEAQSTYNLTNSQHALVTRLYLGAGTPRGDR